MTWQKNYFSSENQPWTRQVEREVDNLKSNFRSAEVNNTTRDDQLASSLRQVSQATIQAQAAADDAQDAADAALAAANTANSALNGLVSLGTDGSTYNVHGGNITANTITATEINSSYVYTGTLSATQIITGTLSANFISGGTINGTNVTITNLDASNITAGTLSVSRLGTGTLPVGVIYAGNISAGQITTGSLSADFISGGTIDASNITGVTISGTTITGGSISGTSITAVNITGTSTVSGATITGGSISGTSITAVNITGTSTVSGAIITGGSISGTTITGSTLTTANSGRRVILEATNATFNDENGNFTGRILGAGTARGATLELTSGASGELQIWNGGVIMYGAGGSYAGLSDNGFGVGGQKLYTIFTNIESGANLSAVGSITGASLSVTGSVTGASLSVTGSVAGNGFSNSGTYTGNGFPTIAANTVSGTSFPANVFIATGGNMARKTDASERRLKENINEFKFDTDAFINVSPVTFNYKRDAVSSDEQAEKLNIGFILDDFEDAGLSEFLVYQAEGDDFKQLRYDLLSIYLHKVVQTQQETIKTLEARLKALEDKVK